MTTINKKPNSKDIEWLPPTKPKDKERITHQVCPEMLYKFGGNAQCCDCFHHKCNYDWKSPQPLPRDNKIIHHGTDSHTLNYPCELCERIKEESLLIKCKHPQIARHPYGFCNNCKEQLPNKVSKEDKEVNLGKKLNEILNRVRQEERKRIVGEIETIEKQNIDKEFDTMDFDSFAEDIILWLNRNRKIKSSYRYEK